MIVDRKIWIIHQILNWNDVAISILFDDYLWLFGFNENYFCVDHEEGDELFSGLSENPDWLNEDGAQKLTCFLTCFLIDLAKHTKS